MHRIDWQAARDTATGIAIDLAGKVLGWLLIIAALWVAVSVIVGSVAIARWLEGKI